MNIARKSTTKLPQSWQKEVAMQSKEDEADSGVASADSTDSFQDALLNLKALSGSGEDTETGLPEPKVLQTSGNGTDGKKTDGVKNGTASPACESEKDLLDQIDDIVSEKPHVLIHDQVSGSMKENDCKTVCNNVTQNSTGSVKSVHSTGEDVLLKKDGDSAEINKVKTKSASVTSAKTSMRIGEKVRSTVHSIMSKLVQSNPDVNSLLSKAKTEDSADSGSSGTASPVPVRHDSRNLFDNFDISEKECKSPLAADKSSSSLQPSSSEKTDDGMKGDPVLENGDKSVAGSSDSVHDKVSKPSSSLGDCLSKSVEKCSSGTASEHLESDSTSVDCVKSPCSDNLHPSDVGSKEGVGSSEQENVEAASRSSSLDNVESSSAKTDSKDEVSTDNCQKEDLSLPVARASESDSKDAEASSSVSETPKAEPMETTDSSSCDKDLKKTEICESDPVVQEDETSDGDRKRTLENGNLESDDSQSQPAKRSRLDEVIGKLGERVPFPFPAQAPENEGADYDDSTPGDTDSVEKQSEEISGCTSEEDEDKSTCEGKADTLRLTKQELEALVVATAKAALERHQSSEILALSRRVEELKQSQEEWRQKAKELERQVLDLTVLQQRLEKRKAHTAALKSITTRSIGVWVTEDRLKVTPQKHPAPKSSPATPPMSSHPSLVLTSGSRSATTTVPSMQSAAVRNTSVAHLLSQTARMPTVASCGAATRPATAKGLNTSIRTPLSASTSVPGGSSMVRGAVPSSVTPTAGLVLVSSAVGMTTGSLQQKSGAGSGSAQVKFIDLTMEDDAGAPKQAGKQVVGAGPVRTVVPQQVVRQIPSMSQTVPGATSSAILLSSAAGTQIVNANNMPQPGMLQVVTIANAQNLRPGSYFTVMPGQPGSLVPQPAATTLTTSARGTAPVLMTQQLQGGVAFVRPPAVVGNNSVVRSPSVASTTKAVASRSASSAAAVASHGGAASGPQQDSQAAASAAGKKMGHPAPLPDDLRPKGLPSSLKPPPPCPGLKISRVKQGIVLSWNMPIPPDCVEIASYQLFAYQETSAAPQTSLWKKVGDVKALPLPMACTLTQFQDGNKYHFAVRAVDVNGRSGPFSEPSFIFLTKAA